MYRRSSILLAAALVSVAPAARGGHELPVYPSYYPHEIDIASASAQQAEAALPSGKMHAYIGQGVSFAPAPPPTIGAVDFLGALIVVRLNADAKRSTHASACAAMAAVLRSIAERGGRAAEHASSPAPQPPGGQAGDTAVGLVVHPYPVTPYHGDYLYHADLAEAATARLAGTAAAAAAGPALRVKVDSPAVRALVNPAWLADDDRWDAAITLVDVRDLMSSATLMSNAWLAPRWVRAGWYHAYRVLADAVDDAGARQEIATDVARLEHARYDNSVDRINLERDVVTALGKGCRAAVAGYTVARAYFNAEFSAGVENIGYDALTGFASPMFLRTVKLKDFPWNGWLQLGVGGRPEAAWNPIAGFTDAFGRQMWFAIADPALVPAPYDWGWMLNRFSDVQAWPQP